MSDTALYFTAPETVEIREITVDPLEPSELLVETRASAISAGTELLVYHNEMPSGLQADETLDALDTDLTYPISYGYAASGVVTAVGRDVSDDWLGRTVFSFVPHQTRFSADPDDVVPLPAGTEPEVGTLLPSVETATNVVLDAAPRIGERVVVLGAGVIGLCTTRLLSSFPLAELVVVDPIEHRRELALDTGADRVTAPDEITDAIDDVDLVIELSGQPSALDDALAVVGYDGRILVGSWYGMKRAPIDLGGRFHRDRIEIVSSQVSTISPELRGRWSRDRRLDTAIDWLERIDVSELISHRIPFARADEAYELLDSKQDNPVQVVLEY